MHLRDQILAEATKIRVTVLITKAIATEITNTPIATKLNHNNVGE